MEESYYEYIYNNYDVFYQDYLNYIDDTYEEYITSY